MKPLPQEEDKQEKHPPPRGLAEFFLNDDNTYHLADVFDELFTFKENDSLNLPDEDITLEEEEEEEEMNSDDEDPFIPSDPKSKAKTKSQVSKNQTKRIKKTESKSLTEKNPPKERQKKEQKPRSKVTNNYEVIELRRKNNLDKNIPEHAVQMIKNNQFYPFDCSGKRKDIITTSRILYLIQCCKELTLEQCRIYSDSDSKRIYDIMNVLEKLGIVQKRSQKILYEKDGNPKSRKVKIFSFAPNVTTDSPIDLRTLHNIEFQSE